MKKIKGKKATFEYVDAPAHVPDEYIEYEEIENYNIVPHAWMGKAVTIIFGGLVVYAIWEIIIIGGILYIAIRHRKLIDLYFRNKALKKPVRQVPFMPSAEELHQKEIERKNKTVNIQQNANTIINNFYS